LRAINKRQQAHTTSSVGHHTIYQAVLREALGTKKQSACWTQAQISNKNQSFEATDFKQWLCSKSVEKCELFMSV
jgi:hypothetical protein